MEESEKRRERLRAMRSESENSGGSVAPAPPCRLSNPLTEALPMEHPSSTTSRFDFYTDPMSAFSAPRRTNVKGVSNCYVFKSRLQEYAQKVGVRTPVYQTTREGPSHEPYFKSSVIVNDVRYDSLPEFPNRKAAEQSAAEVALLELSKSGDVDQSISLPVHETGLSKNLLQEYAQKMNYAIPLYHCLQDNAPGRTVLFQCTIDIGGIRYIGASAKTKKEAEIKAARTALLAIQSLAVESGDKPIETTQLTVLPCKKRPPEPIVEKTVQKAKKGKTKRKPFKKKLARLHKRNGQCGSQLIADHNVGPNPTPNPQDGPTRLEVNGAVSSDVRDMNVEKSTNSTTAMGNLESGPSVVTTSLISSS